MVKYASENIDHAGNTFGIKHTDGVIHTTLVNDEGYLINVQNPLPINGDSVYSQEIDRERSTLSAGWTGEVTDLVDDAYSILNNDTSNNPKTITIWLHRQIQSNILGFGTFTGDFSNTKVSILQIDGNEITLADESNDSTKEQRFTVKNIPPVTFLGLKIEFYTDDPVTVTGLAIAKATQTISRIQGISSLNGNLEDVSTYRNAINVNPGWINKIVNETFHRHTGVSTTPAIAISMGDISTTLTDATGFLLGSEIKISEGSIQEIGLITLTDVTGAPVVKFDRPIGNNYTTAAEIDVVETNMALANGSLESPVIYELDPPPGTVWEITKLLPALVDNLVPDDGKFGGIPALLNGVCFRATTVAGRVAVFANWKTNFDMKLDMFDLPYTDKAPAGNYGVNGKWTFTELQIVAKLNGDASPVQKIEALIQDPLGDLITFKTKGQGRVFSP